MIFRAVGEAVAYEAMFQAFRGPFHVAIDPHWRIAAHAERAIWLRWWRSHGWRAGQ